MISFFKTSVIELKAVKKSSHLHTNDHGYGTNIITSFWKRKNTGIFCCQSGESDRASMQQSRTQKFRALKEMEVSTTTTTNTSITNGLGILQFLPGKTYFITGGTGFLAKAVVEKILRTAPDVGKIFVLIKAKNKEAAMDRLKTEMIDSELFECLKQRHGKYYEDFMLNKLAPVVGNLCESDLGIDANSISEIAEEVDVIINSAANTNFEERYDVSLSTNVLGPRRLMDFTNKYCKNLRVFLHVSTAYVSGEREGMIVEKPFHMGESIAREKAASEFPPLSYPMLDVDGEIEIALDSKVAFEGNLEDQKMKA